MPRSMHLHLRRNTEFLVDTSPTICIVCTVLDNTRTINVGDMLTKSSQTRTQEFEMDTERAFMA